MSRVGKKLIPVADGVSISVNDKNNVVVRGPKGELTYDFPKIMKIEIIDNHVQVTSPSEAKIHKSLHGTTRSLLNNMIEGVTKGFSKTLEIHWI
jgi:large subunit ribosomal protein L6